MPPLVMTLLSACGSVTHELWSHGESKHWTLEVRNVEGWIESARAQAGSAELLVASGDVGLEVGWQRMARETQADHGERLAFGAGAEGTFLARVLAEPQEYPATLEFLLVLERSARGGTEVVAYSHAHGFLHAFDLVRVSDAGTTTPETPVTSAVVERALAKPELAAWLTGLAASGPPRLVGVRCEDATTSQPATLLDRALAEHDLMTLRRLRVEVAWRRGEARVRASLRADALAFALDAACTPGNGIVSWDTRARWSPTLRANPAESRPTSAPAIATKVHVTFQRKELVERTGLSTTARIALTPLAVVVDTATFFVAAWVFAAIFGDDDDVETCWEWDSQRHQFVLTGVEYAPHRASRDENSPKDKKASTRHPRR